MEARNLARMLGRLRISRDSSDDSSDDRPRRRDSSSGSSSDGTGPDKKKFGSYQCPKCKRKWESANSWRKYGQKCQKCNIYVMAYKRRKLKFSGNIDPTKPHPMELCGKCQKLGRSCVNSYN